MSLRALRRELEVEGEILDDLVTELVDVLQVAEIENGVLRLTEAPEDEASEQRRQLTVMFCDLVGSTRLSGALDPEDLRAVVRRYQQVGAEAVERFGGHIAQYLGDGLLVYFGWPRAHEDDAARALRAGLRIIHQLALANDSIEDEFGVRIQVRVGIHTGPVVVGEMGGGKTRETLALGETPNIGARIEGVAPADTVCLSDSTRALVGEGFELHSMGDFELKGLEQPMPVYQVMGEDTASQRFDLATGGTLVPLVDRDEPRALLDQLALREGAALLMRGEAGIGKSRLVHYARTRALRDERLVIECQCAEFGAGAAFHPVATGLSARWTKQPDPLAALLADARMADVNESGAAALAALVGIQPSTALQARLREMSPQQVRATQIAAVGGLLRGWSAAGQVLFCVEDLHWADPSTLELLASLTPIAETHAVFFLLSARPDFEEALPATEVLEVGPLAEADAQELVTRVAGDRSLPPELAAKLAHKTDGVPLFVEELARTVFELGLISQNEDGTLTLAEEDEAQIPATLYGSLMARVDGAGPARPLLDVAAVIGREADLALAAHVLELEPEELERQVAHLVELDIAARPEPGRLVLKHALVQEAAVGALSHRRRHLLEGRVAEALLEHFPEAAQAQPQRIARHLDAAGRSPEAVDWWRNAGMAALQRSANQEAIAHLRQGLLSLQALPSGPEQFANELVLQTLLAVPLTLTRGWANAEVGAAYRRAQDLCDVVGRSPQLLPTRVGLLTYYIVRGHFERARQMAAETLEIAAASEQAALILEAEHDCGTTALYQGHFEPALEHLARVEALFDPQLHHEHVYIYGKDPLAVARVHTAMGHVVMGRLDTALEVARAGVAHTEAWPHPFSNLWAKVGVAVSHVLRAEYELAGAVGAEIVEQAERQGFPNWLAQGLVYLGLGRVLEGAHEEGLAQLEQGLTIWQATGAELGMPLWHTMHAQALLAVDRPEDALAAIDTGLAIGARTGEVWTEPRSRTVRARALAALGRDAEVEFRVAVARARALGTVTLEVEAACGLAEYLDAQDRRPEARAAIEAMGDRLQEGRDSPIPKRAKELERRLKSPR